MTRAASAGSWFYSASNGSSSVEPYSIQENGFNIFGDPSSETYTIPATTATTGLSGTYSFVHFWTTTTGIPLGQKYPAVTAAGLPLETTQLTYLANPIDLVSGLGGTVAGYAASTSYDAFGDVTDEEIGSGTTNLTDINSTYDAHTLRLKDQLVQRHAVTPPTSANVDEEAYNYDPYGNLTSQVSTRLGSASQVETQCFRYDGLDQLTQAWTASDACKTTPTTSSHSQVTDGITGGAYWTTWNYDTTGGNAASDILGEMTSQVQHSLTGGTDTTTTNTFGGANGGPHALTTAATAGGSTSTSTFKYDAAGDMTTRAVPSAGTQALTWNAAGQLTTVSAGACKTTSYVYAPDGSLLLQENPGATTLYLDGEQLTATTSGTTTTVTGARIIPLPSGGDVVRTGATTSYYFEVPDPHGTNDLSLDHTAQTPAWRQFTPYGAPRGTAATWIDNRGFLNKPNDPSTGLTYDGARAYDPATASFTSPDPILTPADPLDLNPYLYAYGNPVGNSDPTGRSTCIPGDPCGGGTPAPAPVDTHMGGLGGTGGQGAGTANTGDGGSASSPLPVHTGPCFHDSCATGDAGGGPAPTGTEGDFWAGTGFSIAGLGDLACLTTGLACIEDEAACGFPASCTSATSTTPSPSAPAARNTRAARPSAPSSPASSPPASSVPVQTRPPQQKPPYLVRPRA